MRGHLASTPYCPAASRMFGRSKPVVFDPYRHRRRRAGLPGWLWVLLIGLATGAGGVIVAQQRWLPERLSAAESSRLRTAHGQAEAERARLAAVLETTTTERDELRRSVQALTADRDRLAERSQGIDAEIAFAVDALAPDPRAGEVQVRAWDLRARPGSLQYLLALTHGAPGARPMDAVLQLVAEGRGPGGVERRFELQPVPLTLPARGVARGAVPLPTGFAPATVTVRVLSREGGRTLGMRIVRVP